MFCHDDPALGLAALALQAEKGDCIDNRTTYFRMEDYVPARVSLLCAFYMYIPDSIMCC